MSQPFLGEIRIFAGNFAPFGWALCDGQLLPIIQNAALFSILGTTYGGNGTTNFALPNLVGRVPMHQGNGPGLTPRSLGELSGVNAVTLQTSEMPAHNHLANANTGAGTSNGPGPTNLWAVVPPNRPVYLGADGNTFMAGNALTLAGGNVPHNNLQPFLALTFIIAMQGIFPSRP